MGNKESKVPWVAMPIQMFNYKNSKLFILKEDDYAFNIYFELAKFAQNPWMYGRTVTTVSLLSDQMPLVADKTKNRAEYKRLLAVLSDRGYIKISPTNYKNDTPITIEVPNAADTIQKEEKDDEGNEFKFNRFVQVTKDDYESCRGNARYFRAWIYAEHRMFRGQEIEGEWVLHNEEWQNVMGIQSKTTICKLFKVMHSLNIIEKIEGKNYTDKNGNVKNEGSKYIPVSKKVRDDRQEKVQMNEAGMTLEKKLNVELDLATDRLDDIDPRAEETNLHKTGWLTAKCWFVWQTTKYKATKERGDKRFGALKEKNYPKYKEIENEGRKLLDKQNSDKAAKEHADAMFNRRESPEEIEFQNSEYKYKKKSNGMPDLSELLE